MVFEREPVLTTTGPEPSGRKEISPGYRIPVVPTCDLEESACNTMCPQDTISLVKPDEVKAIRKRLGLTQAALATQLGVRREAVARWEIGTRPVTGPVALAIRSLKKPMRRVKRPK
jgi:DNA-binding transcriptional regulator YiaG